jgi:hypothetical protein
MQLSMSSDRASRKSNLGSKAGSGHGHSRVGHGRVEAGWIEFPADLHVTIADLGPEASAVVIDARLRCT